jgi:hypothetical protein
MTSIIARSGQVTASIKPNRPSWSDMIKNYPGENISSRDFYPMISQALVSEVNKNARDWENTCATRMSYALNRSGIRLYRKATIATIQGEDKFTYWIRVKELKKYLKERFKGGDFEHTPLPIENFTAESMQARAQDAQDNIIKKITGKHGIIVFDVTGWNNASGHFTLWDGKDLVYVGEGYHNDPYSPEYYFWFYRQPLTGETPKQTIKTTFWELK